MDLEIGGRLERLDFCFALGEDCERWSLDTACGGDVESTMARVEASERAGGVQADQPIGLRATFCGVGERFHLFSRTKVFPCREDRIIGHRLHPKPFDRLGDFADFHDIAENEFAFAAGVASIDDSIHVFALGQLEDLLEAGLGVWDGVERELVRDGWKDAEIPGKFLTIRPHRHS